MAAPRDHRTALFRAAYAVCGSREDAEALVRRTYEHARGRDLPSMLRVLFGLAPARSPAPPADLDGDARVAYAAVADLPGPLRAAIVAVDVAGLRTATPPARCGSGGAR